MKATDSIPPVLQNAAIATAEEFTDIIMAQHRNLVEHGYLPVDVANVLLAALHGVEDVIAGEWFGADVQETFRLAREAAAELLDPDREPKGQ